MYKRAFPPVLATDVTECGAAWEDVCGHLFFTEVLSPQHLQTPSSRTGVWNLLSLLYLRFDVNVLLKEHCLRTFLSFAVRIFLICCIQLAFSSYAKGMFCFLTNTLSTK